jgi:hypothetical protein
MCVDIPKQCKMYPHAQYHSVCVIILSILQRPDACANPGMSTAAGLSFCTKCNYPLHALAVCVSSVSSGCVYACTLAHQKNGNI